MTRPDTNREVLQRSIWTTILPARLLINAQFRVPYPFLPAISRGLGVPLEVASLLLTVRGLLGAASPLFGYMADRYGRKLVMAAGLAMLVAGTGLLAAGRSFGLALAAFALMGLAKSAYDPAMQAYVSDQVPYEKRGRALGLIELSWAASWLLAVPISGWLITRWSWHAPFLAIAVLGMLSLAGTLQLKESAEFRRAAQEGEAYQVSFAVSVRPLLTPKPLLVLAACGLLILANENFYVSYGAWMEGRFGLDPGGLGVVSVVVSLAELAAALLSAGIVDRLGKERALIIGLAANMAAYLLLPRISGGVAGAMAGLLLLAATSEFSIVSSLPLVSELAPSVRGTAMAAYAAVTAGAGLTVCMGSPGHQWGWASLLFAAMLALTNVFDKPHSGNQ